jgi:hypothetical protein
LPHRKHRRQIAASFVAQLYAVAFDGCDQAVAAIEQRLDEGCSSHPHAEGCHFNVAVESVVQVGDDLFADEGLDSASENVPGDEHGNEHDRRGGSDSGQPLLCTSGHRTSAFALPVGMDNPAGQMNITNRREKQCAKA